MESYGTPMNTYIKISRNFIPLKDKREKKKREREREREGEREGESEGEREIEREIEGESLVLTLDSDLIPQ